ISDIEGTAKANEDLMSKVTQLADKENKSAGEKEMLAQYTDQLNETVEDLNLVYDEEADALNLSSDNMKARLKLFEEQEKANAGMERTKEITQELTQVEKELEEVNRLRIENNGESKEVSKDLNEQEQLLMDTYRELRGEYVEVEEQVEESMAAVEQATKDSVDGQKLLYAELSDSQKEAIDEMNAKWTEYRDEATSIFDELSDEIEVTYDELMDMLAENQRVTEDYHKNMAELTKRGLQEGILDQMKEAGYDAAGYAAMLVDLTDEELQELNEAFEGNMKTATEGGLQTVTDGNEKIISAVGHLITEVEGTLSERMLKSGFEQYGKNVGDGVSEGILSRAEKVSSAGLKIAEAASGGVVKFAEIHSTSRLCVRHGEDISEGTAIGIENGESNILTKIQSVFDGMMNRTQIGFKGVASDSESGVNKVGAKMLLLSIVSKKAMDSMMQRVSTGGNNIIRFMQSLSTSLYSALSTMPGQFSGIGSQAMSGLNSGLWGGKARVMATARNIANSVASTMRNALRIHSPSRVMRDDVGFEIPAGVAEGIEGNASSVYKALDSLSNKMRVSTPEL